MVSFAMAMTGSDWRRWLGVIALGVAILMLSVGETLLKGRMSPVGFVVYWSLCFIVTGVAIVLALAEVRSVQRNARAQHRELFESTLREIEKESRTRHKPEDN
jgi:uncharacterized membrane protein YqjE